MRKLKLSFMTIAAMLLTFAACQKEAEPVTIGFDTTSYQMTVGQTLELAADLEIGGTSKAPAFSSSDASVASVDKNGKVTALKQGTATITAKVENVSATCQITVSAVKAGKITLEAPASLPADGSWANVKAVVEPAGYNVEDLVWTMTPSHEEISAVAEKVSASEYKVSFSNYVEGARLTIKVADKNSGLSQTAEIAVTEKIVPATRISLDMPAELTEGQWVSLTATVEPADYDLDNLVWEFVPSAEGLGFEYEKVSAAEYKVCFTSFVEDGSVTVNVSDVLSEEFMTGRIKVLEKPVEGLVSLNLSPATLALKVGDDPVALSVSYEPADYDKSLIEWTSSDETVATVADGVVTAKGEGKATIKIKDTVSEKEATCAVTVSVPVEEAAVTRVDLTPSLLTMRVGEEAVQIVATCYDKDLNVVENYAGLVWSAEKMLGENNKEITVVEVTQQGVVTPKNAGFTQVVVTDKNNSYLTATCSVTVLPAEIKVESVTLEPSAKTIEQGQTFTLTASVLPENAENKTLTYASSDEKVATVTAEGVVTGVASGEATITATSVNGVKGQCKVTVTDEAWVELSVTELTLKVGDESTLTAVVKPDNAPDKTVTWSSSAEDVVSVDGGKVKALKEGTAVIAATASNGAKAECKVTVMTAAVDFDITFSLSDATVGEKGLQQDKSVRILTRYTKKVDGKTYVPSSTSWSSSDESVATVDSEGNITAVIEHIEKSGIENGVKVTITHKAEEKEASMEITVVKALPEQVILTAVPNVDGVDYKMLHGDSFTLKAKVLPEKASQEVWFQCPDLYIAPLEGNVFYAREPRVFNVTGYAADNTDARVNFSIEVLPVPVESFTIVGESQFALEVGDEKFLEVEVLPANASYKTVTWTSSAEDVVSVASDGKVTANAAGTATVTGALKEGQTVEYTITVSEPVVPVNVGDYYYSDGTTSPELDSSKEVVGIVFSTKNPSLQDSGLEGFTNGLVVSLEEFQNTAWQTSATDVTAWVSENEGYDDLTNYDLECGYSNTQALKAYNEANPDTKVLVVEGAPDVVLPSSASGWFVPSYAELVLLAQSYETVSANVVAAGGTEISNTRPAYGVIDYGSADTYRYWASTESSNSYSQACAVQFFDGQMFTNQSKAKGHYRVRYIFAF